MDGGSGLLSGGCRSRLGGESDREFEVNRALARERAAEATEEAIDAHVEAGEDWLVAADRISTGGSQREARQAYRHSRDHFAKARDIAARLRQGRVKHLATQVETIDDRLAGKVLPSVATAKDTLTVDAARNVLDGLVDESDLREGAAAGTVAGQDSEEVPTTIGNADDAKATPGPTRATAAKAPVDESKDVSGGGAVKTNPIRVKLMERRYRSRRVSRVKPTPHSRLRQWKRS